MTFHLLLDYAIKKLLDRINEDRSFGRTRIWPHNHLAGWSFDRTANRTIVTWLHLNFFFI